MVTIDVAPLSRESFRVEVRDETGSSSHEVAATPEQVRRYGGDADAAALVEASFRFLLEREPKESILPRFELSVIERYFPDYPRAIRGMIG